MTLFVAIHHHAPERCPAADPAKAEALLSHLSAGTAYRYGVTVRAEAVADEEHVLYLIAEAANEAQLRRYLTPFAQQGTVEVLSAASCAEVIERASCTLDPDAPARTGRHRQG